MNEQQAKQAFESGHIQPQCPSCGQSILLQGKRVKMVDKSTGDYILAAGYQCNQCGERFVAYIGASKNDT